jgi:hypothetical protein
MDRLNYGTGAGSVFAEPGRTPDPANPKDVIGSHKIPLSIWPPVATALGALALVDGAGKYGRQNYRVTPVRASIYVDAALRHIAAWQEGEDVAPDSGVPHIGHALACLAILADARAAGTLIDDRSYPGGFLAAFDALTPTVAAINARHAGRAPKHYTIKDAPK